MQAREQASATPLALLLKIMEQAANRLLRMDVEQGAALNALHDRTVAVDMRLPGLVFYVTVQHQRLHFSEQPPETVHATLSGTPLALLRLAVSDDPASIFSGDVKISGDAEVGKQIRRVLERLDIDWEEELSRYTGDVVAHQLGTAARSLRNWTRSALESTRVNTGEYLVEELNLLPVRDDVNEFLSAVDEVRADTERLELRVQRLLDSIDKRG